MLYLPLMFADFPSAWLNSPLLRYASNQRNIIWFLFQEHSWSSFDDLIRDVSRWAPLEHLLALIMLEKISRQLKYYWERQVYYKVTQVTMTPTRECVQSSSWSNNLFSCWRELLICMSGRFLVDHSRRWLMRKLTLGVLCWECQAALKRYDLMLSIARLQTKLPTSKSSPFRNAVIKLPTEEDWAHNATSQFWYNILWYINISL